MAFCHPLPSSAFLGLPRPSSAFWVFFFFQASLHKAIYTQSLAAVRCFLRLEADFPLALGETSCSLLASVSKVNKSQVLTALHIGGVVFGSVEGGEGVSFQTPVGRGEYGQKGGSPEYWLLSMPETRANQLRPVPRAAWTQVCGRAEVIRKRSNKRKVSKVNGVSEASKASKVRKVNRVSAVQYEK